MSSSSGAGGYFPLLIGPVRSGHQEACQNQQDVKDAGNDHKRDKPHAGTYRRVFRSEVGVESGDRLGCCQRGSARSRTTTSGNPQCGQTPPGVVTNMRPQCGQRVKSGTFRAGARKLMESNIRISSISSVMHRRAVGIGPGPDR